jgi:uncharacterized protein YjbI with pentapeptide repeats
LWAIRIGIVLGLLVAIGYFYGVTLWDWIKLLIVPAVIAAGGLWFNRQQQDRQQEDNRQQQERDREFAERQTQNTLLQSYLDQMNNMILDGTLPTVPPRQMLSSSVQLNRAEFKAQLAAQSHTAMAFQALDAEHKTFALIYLAGSGLLWSFYPFVHLRGANLRRMNLSEAPLSDTYLAGVSLVETDLSGSYLSFTDLQGANLERADLTSATLRKANLSGANLSEANLSNAYLREANLSGAEGLTEEQLAAAQTLQGATMPNGQKYDDWLKSKNRAEDAKNNGTS